MFIPELFFKEMLFSVSTSKSSENLILFSRSLYDPVNSLDVLVKVTFFVFKFSILLLMSISDNYIDIKKELIYSVICLL